MARFSFGCECTHNHCRCSRDRIGLHGLDRISFFECERGSRRNPSSWANVIACERIDTNPQVIVTSTFEIKTVESKSCVVFADELRLLSIVFGRTTAAFDEFRFHGARGESTSIYSRCVFRDSTTKRGIAASSVAIENATRAGREDSQPERSYSANRLDEERLLERLWFIPSAGEASTDREPLDCVRNR